MQKPIIVMKFGGSSVADGTSRAAVIRQIRRGLDGGHAVVAVVSAMGRLGRPYATDTLLSLTPEAGPRARDLLLGCGEIISACVLANDLCAAGIPAVPMSGAEALIRTDGTFGHAQITDMDPTAVRAVLTQERVPVITGFQGVGPDGQLTTLGRGGSDTSAVEIAGFLGAEQALIFTDVPGVAVCDPRIVPDAPFLMRLDSRDIGPLAEYGAKVIHPRAVAAGVRHRIPIRVLSTFDDRPGTEISELSERPCGLIGIASLRCSAVTHVRSMNAIAFGEGFVLPGPGNLSLISALRRPLTQKQANAVAALGRSARTGPFIQVLVPEAQNAACVQNVYDILKF